MKTKKIYITGMYCVNCEKLLSAEFKKVSGVGDVRVSRKDKSAEIRYCAKEPEFSELKSIACKFGYKVYEDEAETFREPKKIPWREWLESVLILITLLFLYGLFREWGVTDKIDFNHSNITYGISFLIGLTASVSSCLAVVGSVVIAFGEKYKCSGGGFFSCAVKPNVLFHAGRLLTFFMLGGVLGMIGGEINITGKFISAYAIMVAVIMAWLGLNILGILPSLSAVGLRLPQKLTGNWEKLKASEHALAPLFLGGLSFFLPCGFTQSMQVFALASGSFFIGGLNLLMFALGTLPVLLILGITASWTRSRKVAVMQKVAGFLILIFAFSIFNSGFALKGVNNNIFAASKNEGESGEKSENSRNQAEQMVEMHVTYRGFQPNIIKVKKGIPVKWKILGDQVTPCTDRIIVPSLNITKGINSGENIIQFTPTAAGEIPFSCWMGMVRGKFTVE
jgi:sulfite exporter TauE/SafE/copper chaperone CopZ